MYKELDAEKILATAQQISRRVMERFPSSGLSAVAREVHAVTGTSATQARMIAQANIWLTVGVFVLLALLVVLIAGMIRMVDIDPAAPSMADFLQGLDSGMEVIIICGGGILFLVNLETRWKRRRALRRLHELRSLAHVIDMHQLPKDPERILNRGTSTASSPDRPMDRFSLVRYLSYCSELLSVLGKTAALYAQHWSDPVVLDNIDDIESLTTGLSGKVWQKIMIVNLEEDKGRNSSKPRARK